MPPKTATSTPTEKKSVFTLKTILWIIGAQLLFSTVLGSFLTPSGDRHAGNAATVPNKESVGNVVTSRGQMGNGLRPFARPGDVFSLRIDSDLAGFEPIEFPQLQFSTEALSSIPNGTVQRYVDLSDCARRNCSASVHVTWTMRGETFEDRAPLIRFFADKQKKTQLLLNRKDGDEHGHEDAAMKSAGTGGVTDESAEGESRTVYRAYMQPVVTLSPIVDFTSPLPPNAHELVPRVDQITYGPAVYINNFWVLKSHHREVNASTAAQPFHLTVEIRPVPLWKVLMYTQFEAGVNQQIGMTTQDLDEMKRMFSETNPYLLAITSIVTVLHMLFEYLAFSNDVKFWKGRKNFKGLSLRSVAINCYFQTIVFLYLVDSQETSWAILLPSGLGVLTEYWKLTQVVQVVRADGSHDRPDSGSGTAKAAPALTLFGYSLQFRSSYDTRTRRHDQDAIRFLSYAMIPVLLVYSIYSLMYTPHKSWYSYLIHTQVQFVYMFGFVMMLPQIFVNYKMKSVGQLPWRTFIYKALNTVIDDLFAFVVKMPWLHRVACFRDDVVFVILLYQRWVYPVDVTRTEDGDENDGNDDDSATVANDPQQEPALLDSKKRQ